MGLFTSGSDDFAKGRALLDTAIRRFNDISGAAYSVLASVNEENLRECCRAFDRIAQLGFPPEPGPFKRLGAFAILSQAYQPFGISASVPERPLPPHADLIWPARLVVWTLPVFAASLELNDDAGPSIGDVLLPTPHFQVEFIAYLRNMANGAKETKVAPDDGLLLERSTATGLMLEACAYIPHTIPHTDTSFYSKAASCLDSIAADELLRDDWKFNDPNFLDLAVGIGLED